MQPGNNLRAADSPNTPDSRLQTHYRSMVATLQFAASWVSFNLACAVSQLARFCVSAGLTHHAALHHLMECLVSYPSFKLEYSKKSCNRMGLDGFCDSDWGTRDTRRLGDERHAPLDRVGRVANRANREAPNSPNSAESRGAL